MRVISTGNNFFGIFFIIMLTNCGGGSSDSGSSLTSSSPTSNSSSNTTNKPLVETAPKDYLAVALVLDSQGENDQGFNQLALAGVNQAIAAVDNLVFDYVVSQPTDSYQNILEKVISSGYDLIITIGLPMAEATAQVAKTHPTVYFAIIEVVYDNYQTLPNVASVSFAEDQMGYLAGVLASCVSTSNIIGSIYGGEVTTAVLRLIKGFQNGARSVKPFLTTLHQTVNADDFVTGRQYAESLILQGADVIFGAGGQAGNGALEAASSATKKAIGVNIDQYFTVPEKVGKYLISSAIKQVDVATKQIVLEFSKNKKVNSGVYYFTAVDNGIGLASYHDWNDRVLAQCKQKVEQARQDLASGKIGTGVVD